MRNALKNYCQFGVIFKVNLVERIAGELLRLILFHFWTNHFPILLRENPKTSIFMISGFLGPVGTLIYGFEYTKIPNTYNI